MSFPINRLKRTISYGFRFFLCSHILEIAERLCTRVAVIDNGRVLAAGNLDDLRNSKNETLEDIFIRLVGKSINEIEAENITEEE